LTKILTLTWLLLLSLLLLSCGSDDTVEESLITPAAPTLKTIEPSPTAEIPTEAPQANIVNLPLSQQDSSTPFALPSATAEPLPTLTTTPQPVQAETTPTQNPEPIEPTSTPTPSYPVYQGAPIDRDSVGLQIHLHREDLDSLMAHLTTLDVGWVKVQVSWKIYQPAPGRFDDDRFGELDRLIAAAADENIKVLLGVAKAPEWSRPTTELDGPPADFSHFESFMNILASRYQGRVAAYELWNESNLQREWNGYPLNAADLVALISAGARGVTAADPNALLVSGAPAPTGINDGLTAIDDRVYLQQMLDAGITRVVDAIGIHPYGWANPPDSSYANPDPAIPSHNNHPSFFFLDTLTDYRAILDQRGYSEVPLWVTEFGWGTFDGLDASPPDEVAFMANVDETQQALYTLRSYDMASQWTGIGPLFLWNLNFGPRLGSAYAESGFSLLRHDGSARPAYLALTTITKTAE